MRGTPTWDVVYKHDHGVLYDADGKQIHKARRAILATGFVEIGRYIRMDPGPGLMPDWKQPFEYQWHKPPLIFEPYKDCVWRTMDSRG